jgi:DNA-binding beta-propeller fold protein YncE
MDYEPEYIAVNAAGTKAYVTLQEANAIGVLNLQTNSFEKVIGLGVKDFSLPGNSIDPLNNGIVDFIPVAAKGLYMPDGVATYERSGKTFVLLANEGDFREDDADRSAASNLGAVAPLNNLRVSNTDSSAGNLYTAGSRSFSIRDVDGNIVYDSADILDRAAFKAGVYDDGRSRDKGVEPEGIEVLAIGDRTFAFVGLERTTKSSIGIFDITDPANTSFVDLLVSDTDVSPEGLKGFVADGNYYLAFSNEVSSTTSVYQLTPIPEPGTYALMLAGLGVVAVVARRRKR